MEFIEYNLNSEKAETGKPILVELRLIYLRNFIVSKQKEDNGREKKKQTHSHDPAMSINKCDKTMEKSINWIFIVMMLSQLSIQIHGQSEPEQIPLVRLPSNTLLKYTAYKDVSILHFVVPTDTRTAFFNFKAYEETKSAFRKYKENRILKALLSSNEKKKIRLLIYRPRFHRLFAERQCKPRDVTLHLKSGSYPVISPDNITFPKHFLHADQR